MFSLYRATNETCSSIPYHAHVCMSRGCGYHLQLSTPCNEELEIILTRNQDFYRNSKINWFSHKVDLYSWMSDFHLQISFLFVNQYSKKLMQAIEFPQIFTNFLIRQYSCLPCSCKVHLWRFHFRILKLFFVQRIVHRLMYRCVHDSNLKNRTIYLLFTNGFTIRGRNINHRSLHTQLSKEWNWDCIM